jgi:hypothetical protein
MTPAGTTAQVRLTQQQVLDLARAAHRAPSLHNSQPWTFRALPGGLEIREDLSRSLPDTDPDGRMRLMSCGAAVENAAVALARMGYGARTQLFPGAPGVVATVTAGLPAPVRAEAESLYRALWQRRTHRRIFLSDGPADAAACEALARRLREAVAVHGARLSLLGNPARTCLAEVLWRAAREQAEDDGAQADLQAWTRDERRSADGVPARSHATAPFPVDGLLRRPLPRAVEMPPWVGEDLRHGLVAVLLTDRDERLEWVRAGRALESLLLTATAAGLVASFLNQPVQQARFRPEVAAVTGQPGWPQAVLRLGEPLVTVPETPRRPLPEVLQG